MDVFGLAGADILGMNLDVRYQTRDGELLQAEVVDVGGVEFDTSRQTPTVTFEGLLKLAINSLGEGESAREGRSRLDDRVAVSFIRYSSQRKSWIHEYLF